MNSSDNFLPLVDEKGKLRGQNDKWKIHEQGLLHKGFSVALFVNGKILLQVRKHKVFDGVIDITASSHPLFNANKTYDEKEAVFACLKREWNVGSLALNGLKSYEPFIYKAIDNNGYIEHELCTVYQGELKEIPKPNFDFCYGYLLLELSYLLKNQKHFNLAPWAKKALPLLKP